MFDFVLYFTFVNRLSDYYSSNTHEPYRYIDRYFVSESILYYYTMLLMLPIPFLQHNGNPVFIVHICQTIKLLKQLSIYRNTWCELCEIVRGNYMNISRNNPQSGCYFPSSSRSSQRVRWKIIGTGDAIEIWRSERLIGSCECELAYLVRGQR